MSCVGCHRSAVMLKARFKSLSSLGPLAFTLVGDWLRYQPSWLLYTAFSRRLMVPSASDWTKPFLPTSGTLRVTRPLNASKFPPSVLAVTERSWVGFLVTSWTAPP